MSTPTRHSHGYGQILGPGVTLSNGTDSPAARTSRAGLDPEVLDRWMGYLGLAAATETAIPLRRLDRKDPNPTKPDILSWTADTKDRLPVVVSNKSNKDDQIPGFLRAHKVAMHPTPKDFVGVAWTSPMAGKVRIESAIKHVHTACGNGVVWWVEHRHGGSARKLGKGPLGIGKEDKSTFGPIEIEKGDVLLAAIGPRDHDHTCDLTEVEFAVIETGDGGRRWDLAGDVADTIQADNPHADRFGNAGVWQFVSGADPDLKFNATATWAGPKAAPGSLLAQWRETVGDPAKIEDRRSLERKVRDLLVGPRPKHEEEDALKAEIRKVLDGDPKKAAVRSELFRKLNALPVSADAKVHDNLTHAPGTLIRAEDILRWRKDVDLKSVKPDPRYGLVRGKYRSDAADEIVLEGPSTAAIHVPAFLTKRRFLAEAAVDPAGPKGIAVVSMMDGNNRDEERMQDILLVPADAKDAVADFRKLFPGAFFYPNLVPVDDDGITLRHYHREDEALSRLMLDAEQRATLDRLWAELHFVAQDAKKIHDSFDQFIGYASQVGLVPEFEPKRAGLRAAAETLAKDLVAAEPKHLAAVLDFADRAYRRPLRADEKAGLESLYASLRKKDVTHDEAIRTVLVRVLVSPNFLYRLESPRPKTGPVTDAELATRLSYARWASAPDAELRKDADANRLHETLAEQAERMRKSPRIRGLATEFGLQWLGVRDIAEHKDKSETLFPMFDAKLRQAFFEESALVFEDLFRNDRPVLSLLDDDHVFVNDVLAKHYGIPGVQGPQWRRLDGAKKYGRGGVLTMASVLTKQAGASRTSPVLRGNWLVDVLLDEKLPRPPADVPQLPEAEDTSKLTVRQLVEQHTKDARCARCHVRIDPLGFSLEEYDAIGRRRTKDLAGRPIDAKAELRDGTVFDGVDGLRMYLLTKRRDDFERTFCQLLSCLAGPSGDAVGRAARRIDG